MKCERCKEKDVDVIVKVSFNAKEKEIPLCFECANIIGYTNGKIKKANITEYIKNLIEDNYPKEKRKLVCNVCNLTYKDFLRYKKFGCPFCYMNFADILSYTFKDIVKLEYKNKIEDRLYNEKKDSTSSNIYLKLKTYLDYGDSEMIQKTIKKVKKYDNT